MKISFLYFVLFFILANRSFGLGIGSWQARTAAGTLFDCDYRTMAIRIDVERGDFGNVDSVDKWYFYKDCIVGTSHQSTRFFVINEAQGRIISFDSETSWRGYLKANDLVPDIMTNWWVEDWTVDWTLFYFGLCCEVVVCFVVVPIIQATYEAITKKRRTLKAYLFQILWTILVLWVLTAISMFQSFYPQSI